MCVRVFVCVCMCVCVCECVCVGGGERKRGREFSLVLLIYRSCLRLLMHHQCINSLKLLEQKIAA